MREFGERCLTNDPDAYLVKADVTTMYREFANAEGYESGENVHNVLHNVLRGVPGLNYTDSRPERPDYSDVDLPLRGWDERKTVVDRVTLTDEGLKHAKSAGIVRESPEKSTSTGPKATLKAGEVDLSDSLTDKSKLPPVRGTVAAVWRGRYSVEAEIVSEEGSFDMEIRGFDAPGDVPLSGGVEYEISGLRARNPNGKAPYVEFRPTSTPNTIDRPDDEQSSVDEAAVADGGDAVDRDAEPQYTQAVAKTVHEAAEPVGVAHIIQNTEGSPEPLRAAIDAAREQGKITKQGDDKYTT
jgi:hypothetical protein